MTSTPGPWGYEYSPANDAYEIAPYSKDEGWLWEQEVCITADNNEANARLITAAPDLLDVLTRLVKVAKMNRYRDAAQLSLGATPIIEQAQNAIAKAGGQA